MKDSSVLFRDILGDSAEKATSAVRPSDEALAQIDEPAPDNTWHDAPNLSKDDLKKNAQSVYKRNTSDRARSGAPTDGSSAVDSQQVDELQNATAETADKKKTEYRERVRSYLRTKMPQERRDQAIWRLKVSNTRLTLLWFKAAN